MAARLDAYGNSIHIKNINIILQTYDFYTFNKRPNGKKNRETQVFRRMSQKHKSNRSKKKSIFQYIRKENKQRV